MNTSQALPLNRLPLVGTGLAALVCGVLGGLARLPVDWPPARSDWVLLHGPLMVCSFLGTVISLERAVGLPDRWPILAPVVLAMASLLFLAGVPPSKAGVLLLLGSLLSFAVALRVSRIRSELFTWTLAVGVFCWLVGNILWLNGHPVSGVVPWWIAFLGLTILGERIDLSRFQKPSPWARPQLLCASTLFLVGVATTALDETIGQRLLGTGLVALGVWLIRHDLARKTARQPGLPRFMSLGLIPGFLWMALSGWLFLLKAPLQAGFLYDAALHAFFLGFVFSMIFAHAPVIFPSLLGLTAVWKGRFYVHLLLLQVGLVTRVAGDLLGSVPLRQWGGILNAVAIAVFLLNTVSALVGRILERRKPGARPTTNP